MTRALLYIRQSVTKEAPGESLSLAFQERTLRQMLAKLGATVLEPPVIDPDEKGWDPHRPGLGELVRRTEAEKPAIIAVYAVSRFARDNWLQESIWRRLKAINPELQFVSATEPHAEDDLVRGILGVVSQAERKRMGAFLSSAFRERARRGLPHGRTPFGYGKRDDGRLAVDPETQPVVLQIVDWLEDGWSLWRIARELNAVHAGGRTWEPNVVRNLALGPAIAGGVRCADVLTWDAHEAIIDRERWQRLGTILAKRRGVRTKLVSSWLEGFIACGCGAPMHLIADRFNYDPPAGQFRCSASPSLESFQRPRAFPPCAFSPRSIMAARAEQETIAALLAAFDSLLPADDVFARASAIMARDSASVGRHRRDLERQLRRAESERERLLVLYRRGSLDVPRWEAEDAAAAGRITILAAELAALGERPSLAAIEQHHRQLAESRDALASAVAVDARQARQIMQRLDVRAQRSRDGITLLWPSALSPHLSAVS